MKKKKKRCATEIRGGNWDEGPYESSGGSPVACVVVFDHNPTPLDSLEIKGQTRMTNSNNLHAKYEFRKIINSSLKKDSFNGIHSSDNEQDARMYLNFVGKGYLKKILEEVELKRKHRQELKERERTIDCI